MRKVLFLAMLTILAGAAAYAQPVVSATIPSEYCPGETIDVTVNATGITADVSAIGASIWTPSNWGAPTIVAGEVDGLSFRLDEPSAGSDLTYLAWIPVAGIDETVTLRYLIPVDWTGPVTISTQGEWRGLNDGDNYWSVITAHQLTECDPNASIYHSADTNEDNVISLPELLRLIQFFNLVYFHCDALGEDGYNPGIGDTSCEPHDSDYYPQNWSIELTELLRLIQLFNVGGYSYCPDDGTEDGFCVGL